LYDNTQQIDRSNTITTPHPTQKSIEITRQIAILLDNSACRIKKASCMMSINNATPSHTPHKNNEWEKNK
jgi:hypothetical protein